MFKKCWTKRWNW